MTRNNNQPDMKRPKFLKTTHKNITTILNKTCINISIILIN